MHPLLSAIALLAADGGSDAPPLNPDEPTQRLAWSFQHELRTEGSMQVFAFRSSKPISEEQGRKTFLRFDVTLEHFPDQASADAAFSFSALMKKADPNIGLSYAWDEVMLEGSTLVHLAAPCLFSKANFTRLAANLETALGRSPERTLRCECGFGCTPR